MKCVWSLLCVCVCVCGLTLCVWDEVADPHLLHQLLQQSIFSWCPGAAFEGGGGETLEGLETHEGCPARLRERDRRTAGDRQTDRQAGGDRQTSLLLSHPQLPSDALPVPFFILPAELLQRVHLFLTPPTFVDGWVEEVLPEAAQVVRIPRSFKLGRSRKRETGSGKLLHLQPRSRPHLHQCWRSSASPALRSDPRSDPSPSSP